jgi:hypothetical protein
MYQQLKERHVVYIGVLAFFLNASVRFSSKPASSERDGGP